jgi:uncharacterized repeat protein (TIGR01451 family)
VDFTLLTLGTFFHATQNFPPGWNCTINLQAISCDRTTLGAGASDLLPLAVDSVQIDSLATSIDLAAQLTVTNPAVNLIRPVSATVGAHPFVMAQKVHSSNNSDTASFVSTPGLTVAFTITVTNTRSGGGAAATSFTVRDTLPQGFSFVGTNPPNVCTANNLALDCPFSNLPDGGSFSFQVIVQPLNLGTFTNTVTVLGVQPLQGAGQNPSLTTTHITGPSEPTMTGVATNFTILPGDDPGFIYTIDNPATTDAQGLHVDFTLATLGTVFKALQTFPPGWICSINLQTIACDKATLSAGASDVLSPAVDSAQIDSSATSIDISAQLTAITPSTNLVRPVSATVGAHPFVIAQKVHSINNSDTASFVSAPGLTVAFTITVTNMRSGGGATATTFSMFDTLPIGFVFVDTNPPGLCNSTSPNQLECPFTNLADGGSFSFQIIVQPLSLGTFVNTVFAGNVQPLQGAGQPPSQTTTTITAPSGPDLSAACSCTSANCSDRLNPGETFTSECTVEELNNLDALAGQWTCQSSGGIRFRSITGSSGGCSIAPDGLSLSCQDDNPASSTRTYHLESETVNHSDPDESYVCSVQQAGDTDLTNNSSTVIVDGNESPVAAYTFTCSALDCTFDSSGSADSDGNIVSRDWDFDNDGVVDASGPLVPHSFSAAGIFDVRLAVTDDNGATGSTIQQVTVAASPPSNLTDIHVTRTAGPGPFSSVSSFRHDASANTLAIRMTPPPATFPIPYPGTQPGPIVGDNSLIAVGEADVFDLDFNDGFVTFFTGDGMGNFTQDGTPIPVGSLVAALAFDPTKTLLFASVSSPTFEQQIVVINVASKTVVNVVPSTMTSTFAATALLANPDPSLRVLYGLGSNASPSVGLFMWTYDLSGNLFRDFNVPAIAFPNSFAIKNQRLYIGTNASGAMGQSAGLQYAINLVAGLPAGNNFIGPIGGGGLLGEAVVRDAATGNVCKYAVDGIGNLRIFSVNENTLAIVETLSSPFLAQLGEFFFLPVAHPSQPIIYVFGVGNFDPDGPGPIPALPAAVLDVFNVDTQTCDLSNPPAGALRTIVPGPPGPISSALVVPQ